MREVGGEKMDCVFCKIINGEIPSNKLYEDEQCLAFADASPQAPVHFLVIPKDHIASMEEIREEQGELIGHIFAVISRLAKEQGLTGGYRVVNNCLEDGGQTVPHLHFHVLGGRMLQWPPG